MPSVRDFRKTDVFLYFLHYLDEFRQRPFKQLMEERKRRFEEFDGARKKYYAKYYLTPGDDYCDEAEVRYLQHTCAYDGAIFLNNPNGTATLELVSITFEEQYANLREIRKEHQSQSSLNEDHDKVDRDIHTMEDLHHQLSEDKARMFYDRHFSPDGWIDRMYLNEEFMDVIGKLSKTRQRIIYIYSISFEKITQKDMGKIIGHSERHMSKTIMPPIREALKPLNEKYRKFRKRGGMSSK